MKLTAQHVGGMCPLSPTEGHAAVMDAAPEVSHAHHDHTGGPRALPERVRPDIPRGSTMR
jgi:metal-dependent hydrolase (beta-lactamase superfamily II)